MAEYLLSKHQLTRIPVFVVGLVLCTSNLWAQNFGYRQSVGGVSISAEGLVAATDLTAQRELLAEMAKALKPVTGALKQFNKLRKVSLRGLKAELAKHSADEPSDLSQTVQMLAGLQQVQYIFVYPESNDIVLAGPAEGWQVSPEGEIVGLTTGKPVLRLGVS